jgi:aconitate hydratase
MSANSFDARAELEVSGRSFEIFRLDALSSRFDVASLPFSLKILLENLLRTEGNGAVGGADIEALACWDAAAEPSVEIAFTPARVLLQDFTGVPAVVDLAAMRDAIVELGGSAGRIDPLVPAELVIDHSVQVDVFGTRDAFARNAAREFERNSERYAFLRWGQSAFERFAVVPPDTGIVHQVNLEYLARVVFVAERDGALPLAYPDTLVGTDSHTTMVNGLGVLGWGVGGIEAEAAMLGQPMSMLLPQVVGFRLVGALPEGATATDLVLTVTEMLRAKGVVGRIVEFFGPGLAGLPLADRATIGNMSPEFGSTAAIFPIDAETLRYLRFTGRPEDRVELVEAYAREQGLWHDESSPDARYSDTLELDLGEVEPSLAGPRRPQDRVPLRAARERFHEALASFVPAAQAEAAGGVAVAQQLDHGAVVIAAITSCTNTSNPSVMVAAGLLARAAAARGLTTKPWVKTSLAPGSRVVTEYLERAGLTESLEALGFNLVGYGCTTCIGNSGPLPEEVSKEVAERDLAVVAVLSGNRNFEGRIQSEVKMNYLASPPLVVAYALAGTMDIDLVSDALGVDAEGEPVYLRDIWPSSAEIAETVGRALRSDMFASSYAEVFDGDENWHSLEVPTGEHYDWRESTYVRRPPFFEALERQPSPPADIAGARVLAMLGDSVTTDHISPAGAIKRDSPAGRYLQENGVGAAEFNSYGARRGNHEVMVRGTFANIRLRNLLGGAAREPLPEGGFTRHLPDGEVLAIYDAAMRYAQDGVPLVVLGGRDYGAGSSRDWAAKGPRLLGVRAVIAESFERIHRSNLVGMGLLPLQFMPGDSAASLGLTGEESISIDGVAGPLAAGERPSVASVTADGRSFQARVRIDTPMEVEYYRHGGILQYVLRQLLAS